MSVCSCAFGEPNGQVTLFVSGTGEGQKMSCRTQNAAESSLPAAERGIPVDGICSGSESSLPAAERGILVSGDAGELLTAKRRGMAALGYSGKAADRVSALCGAAAGQYMTGRRKLSVVKEIHGRRPFACRPKRQTDCVRTCTRRGLRRWIFVFSHASGSDITICRGRFSPHGDAW